MRPENQIIVDWIQREMDKREWLQKDLIDRLPGWGQSTISKVMVGKRTVSAPEIMLLLQRSNVTSRWWTVVIGSSPERVVV